MIRKLLARARAAANDPFVVAGVALVLLSTGLQGIAERVADAREDLAQLAAAAATVRPAPAGDCADCGDDPPDVVHVPVTPAASDGAPA